jgi:hypothetical protein
MDIDTLIFIILTVIGVLVSVFGKKKKLFDSGEAEAETFPAFPEVEHYPGEYSPEREEEPFEEEEKEPGMNGEEEGREEKSPEMVAKEKKEEDKILQEENTPSTYGNPLQEDIKNFSLRKAVIYSEILQRKYFS